MRAAELHLVPVHGARSGSGPATWGQEYIHEIIEVIAPHDSHLGLVVVVTVPPGTTVPAAEAALADLVAAHDVLRTGYRSSGAVLQQHVAGASWVPVTWWRVAEGEDPDAAVAAARREVVRERFDPADPCQLRCIGLGRDGAAGALVLGLCHVAADHHALGLLERDLRARVDGGRPPAPVVAPLDQAAWEASPEGASRNRESLVHWARTLRRFPDAYPGDGALPAASPRYRTARLCGPEPFRDAVTAARGAGVTPAAVVTAAFATALGGVTGLRRVPFLLRTGNRDRPGDAALVGHQSEQVPLVVDLDADDPVTLLRAVHRTCLATAGHGRYRPSDLHAVLAAERRRRGRPAPMRVTLNITSPPEAVTSGGGPAGTGGRLEHTGGTDTEDVALYVDVWPDVPALGVLADTRFLPVPGVGGVLTGMASALRDLAAASRGGRPSPAPAGAGR